MDMMGAKKDKKTERLMKKQKADEELRLAEEESVIARRKALGTVGTSGRSLLTKTSQRGVTKFSGEM
jgi:hypothetical protein